MSVVKVLAALPVADMEASLGWYERLFGRAADDMPMPEAAEWQLTGSGSLQIVHNPDHAGSGFVTLAVDDIDEQVAAAGEADLHLQHSGASTMFRLATIRDPDGNVLTFAQDVRPSASGSA
jgi:catechol 2,3-dioxygenase-like lactoylglutathione lyase family enzyme